MINYNEAVTIISEEFRKLQPAVEKVNLLSSVNRILAENITADINLPPFNNSAMDGYAILYAPGVTEWEIKGTISAGHYRNYSADTAAAIEIMTGSKIPDGFDTIIPVEDVFVHNSKISLLKGAAYKKGINIRKAGEDITAGKTLVHAGTKLAAKEIAALASVGKTEVSVIRNLKIGVLSTGDELIDISETPTEDKIRASNLYALISAVHEINMEPVNLGILKDNRESIKGVIDRALTSELEILVTTGGVSVGKYDLLKEILIEAGVEIKFHKVNIKPGKPVLFGTFNNGNSFKLIFALPGNPVSALTAFIIFIEKTLGGYPRQRGNFELPAVLGNDIKKNDSKLHFIRGNIQNGDGILTVYADINQSSGNIAQMASANCLIMIDEDKKNPRKGEKVNCIMI